MWVVALIYAAAYGFQAITGVELLWLGLIAGASTAVDYLGGVLGAKLGGASLKSVGYGAIGMVIGLILFPPLGGMIGMFTGIAINEYRQYHSRTQALKAASGGLIGSVAATAINLGLGTAFLVLFALMAK